MIFGGPVNMQILISLFDHFCRKPRDQGDPTHEPVMRPIKPTKVQKHQAKELAEAEMNLVQCESNEEYYRHQSAFYRERIARLKGDPDTHFVGGSV